MHVRSADDQAKLLELSERWPLETHRAILIREWHERPELGRHSSSKAHGVLPNHMLWRHVPNIHQRAQKVVRRAGVALAEHSTHRARFFAEEKKATGALPR